MIPWFSDKIMDHHSKLPCSSGNLKSALHLAHQLGASWRPPSGERIKWVDGLMGGPIPQWFGHFVALEPSRSDMVAGWWLGHPYEKYESQLGWLETQYMGK